MKILSISNNFLSLNNPNGKFCRNYLHSFKDDELSSFYISNDEKKENETIQSFNYTDADLIAYIFHKKHKTTADSSSSEQKVNKKSPFIRFVRYVLWRLFFTKNKSFKEWLDSINPTHVVLTIGDNPYLFFLSRLIAKKRNCKLVLFCSENYAFKKYNYLQCKKRRSLSFLMFQHKLRVETIKTIKQSQLVIYNSEQLKTHYEVNVNHLNGVVVLPLSASKYARSIAKNINNEIVYAGNLGVGRSETIVKFAEILNTITEKHKVVVYGFATKEQQDLLAKTTNVEYKGIITNDQLINVINNSWLSLHVESFDEYRKIDLEYAFSTKLSDLIASNDRFFVFAPDCYVESKFFIEHLRNHIALDDEELKTKMIDLVKNGTPFLNDDNTKIREKMNISKNADYIKELMTNL